ncbi:MAG: hypothetical protein FWC62_02200 [Firmicutes bacterium]|nr:hypothetical protein [Bacillota bacterium]
MNKKYVRDFRLEESLDSRGRVKKTATYIGGDYIFADPEAASKKNRLRIAVLTALCWPIFLAPLFPVTRAGKLIYAILPFAGNILVLSVLSMSAYSLLRAGEVMHREQAMKLSGRLPACALFVMILSGIAVLSVAFTALLLWRALPFTDALFLACAALLCALGAVLFKMCRKIKVMKRENVE